MDQLLQTVVTQMPNFIGLVVALIYLWRDGQRQSQRIDKLIDVIVNRENCPEETPN